MKVNVRIWPMKMTGEDLENLLNCNNFLYKIIDGEQIYIEDDDWPGFDGKELLFSSNMLNNNLSFPPRQFVMIGGCVMESDIIFEIENLNKNQIFYLFDIIDIDSPLLREVEYNSVVDTFEHIDFSQVFKKFDKLGIYNWGDDDVTLEEKRFDIVFDFEYVEPEFEDDILDIDLSLYGYINDNKKPIKL